MPIAPHKMHTPPDLAFRAACLRGISQWEDGPCAIVSFSAEQALVLPLPTGELPRWQARVGQRVWVDLDATPMRLRLDLPGSQRHA